MRVGTGEERSGKMVSSSLKCFKVVYDVVDIIVGRYAALAAVIILRQSV